MSGEHGIGRCLHHVTPRGGVKRGESGPWPPRRRRRHGGPGPGIAPSAASWTRSSRFSGRGITENGRGPGADERCPSARPPAPVPAVGDPPVGGSPTSARHDGPRQRPTGWPGSSSRVIAATSRAVVPPGWRGAPPCSASGSTPDRRQGSACPPVPRRTTARRDPQCSGQGTHRRAAQFKAQLCRPLSQPDGRAGGRIERWLTAEPARDATSAHRVPERLQPKRPRPWSDAPGRMLVCNRAVRLRRTTAEGAERSPGAARRVGAPPLLRGHRAAQPSRGRPGREERASDSSWTRRGRRTRRGPGWGPAAPRKGIAGASEATAGSGPFGLFGE